MRFEETGQTLGLPDGRTLGFAEWGDPSGVPLVHFHGSSSSRLEHPLHSKALEGVRLVTIDRPGHGLSSFQPARTLLDWPHDVMAIADHLGLERFALSGWSAGGPYALACAHRIPERLTAVGVVSGVGPYDRPDATAGMDRFNKIALAMARRLPWAASRRLMAMMGRTFMKDPERAAQRRFASSPEPDQEAMAEPGATDMLLTSMVESFRTGSDGSAWEARLLTLPWGFDPRDIAIPVTMWHGDADVNSPIATATYLRSVIPDAALTVFPGEGHFFILQRWGEIVRHLTAGRERDV